MEIFGKIFMEEFIAEFMENGLWKIFMEVFYGSILWKHYFTDLGGVVSRTYF